MNRFQLARERDALQARVRVLEAAIDCIDREVEGALADPVIAFLVTRRVGAVTRQALRFLTAVSPTPMRIASVTRQGEA